MLDESEIVHNVIDFETTVSIPLSDQSMEAYENVDFIITIYICYKQKK